MNNEKTGMLIAQIRKENGLTQKQLADKIGVSNATISKWETAKKRMIKSLIWLISLLLSRIEKRKYIIGLLLLRLR